MAGTMNRDQGRQILAISERTLRRYLKFFIAEGVVAIKHGNCNKIPINAHDEGLKKRVQEVEITRQSLRKRSSLSAQ